MRVPRNEARRARDVLRTARTRRRLRLDPRGQGLVEFAISLPVVLLMILFGVDFGRVFLGWVTLSNAVREASNFAAINPSAWDTPGSPNARAEYERLIRTEAANINCALPGTLPAPAFPSGKDIGSPAIVAITCEFTLITPVIGNIVGNPLDVSSSAAFPIRSGAIGGTPAGGTLPTAGPTRGPGGPPPPPPASVDPDASPVPTPSSIITPEPTCFVPDLVSGTLKTNQAQQEWGRAGFSSTLQFSPLVPKHYDIADQSLDPGISRPCTTVMTVYETVQP